MPQAVDLSFVTPPRRAGRWRWLAGPERRPRSRRPAEPAAQQAPQPGQEGHDEADPAGARHPRRRRLRPADQARAQALPARQRPARHRPPEPATLRALGLLPTQAARSTPRPRRRGHPRQDRQCESGGDPTAVRQRPYLGKYQFSTRRGSRSAAPATPPRPTMRRRTRWRSSSTSCAAPPPGLAAAEPQPDRPAGRVDIDDAALLRDLERARHHPARHAPDGSMSGRKSRPSARAASDGQIVLPDRALEQARSSARFGVAHCHRSVSGVSRMRRTRAGAPAATAFAGRSLVTTVLVPTTQLSPMVTPRRMHAP